MIREEGAFPISEGKVRVIIFEEKMLCDAGELHFEGVHSHVGIGDD